MDRILSFAEKDREELKGHIDSLTSKEICKYLEKMIRTGSENGVELLVTLFKGISCTTDVQIKKRKAVYCSSLGLLQRGDLPNRLAIDILGVLISETNAFPALILEELSSSFIDSIKKGEHKPGRWIELYPQILSSIVVHDKVLYDGGYLSGEDYKSHMISELCSARWPTSYVTHLIIMFKDMVLSSEELETVLNKILRMLPDLEYENIPPVVYQMLLFSVKGHKQLLLKGLITFFGKLEETAQRREIGGRDYEIETLEFGEEDLYRCEGTSIVHCLFAMKYDQELGKELIKLIKISRNIPEDIFSPFPFALSLAVASVDKFQLEIFGYLKTALFRYCKDTGLLKNSHWMREMASGNRPFLVEDAIAFVITRSVGGWDSVLEGLVDFAFSLLDFYGAKSSDVNDMVCAQAKDIVLKVFKGCSTSRQSILRKLFDRLKPPSSATVYVEILSRCVGLIPHAFLESGGSLVHNVLDNLVWYPVSMARSILAAVHPLLDLNPALQDATVLTLRKAMFSNRVDGRKIAICGFLTCLNNVRVLGSISHSQNSGGFQASQVHASMHVPIDSATSEGLCLELLGMLQRSLSQQADVRTMFYQGLPGVILKNPQLTTGALDVLLRQAHLFVEPGCVPPLKLQNCIRMKGLEVVQLEPLPYLLSCISRCMDIAKSKFEQEAAGSDEEVEEDWTDPLLVMLKDLLAALAKLELEDFALDKTADFDGNSSVGLKNVALAMLLLGSYEAMMEFAFWFDSYSPTTADQIAQLYENYRKLNSLLKEKGATKKKSTTTKKKNTAGSPAETNDKNGNPPLNSTKATEAVRWKPTSNFKHLFSSDFIVKILKAIFFDDLAEHQEALSMLREVPGFEQMLINIAILKVQESKGRNPALESKGGSGVEDGFRYCCAIGVLFYRRYGKVVTTPVGKKSAELSMKHKCLEGLVASLTCILETYPMQLNAFLQALVSPPIDSDNLSLGSQSQRSTKESVLPIVLEKFKNHVTVSLTHEDNSVKMKELGLLMKALYLLVNLLKPDTDAHGSLTKWELSLVTDNELSDVAVAKSLVGLLSTMTRQHNMHLTTLHHLCLDYHMSMGDVDEDSEFETPKKFTMVTKDNSSALILTTMQDLEAFLHNISWVLTGLTSRLALNKKGGPILEKRINSLCLCLAQISFSLLDVVQTCLPAGPCIDLAIKLTTRYYSVLTEFSKFQFVVCGLPNVHLCSRFEKLVGRTNSELTPFVYSFISYVNDLISHTNTTNAKRATSSNSSKNSKLMGPLIFNIEQYESSIIKLEKKSKVTLTKNMKLNTNRDFNIDIAAMQQALANQSESDNEEQPPDNDEDSNNSLPEPSLNAREVSYQPPNKKLRLQTRKGSQKTQS